MRLGRRIASRLVPFCLAVVVASPAIGQAHRTVGPTVTITHPDETKFPEISVFFEVRKPDGSYLLNAGRDEFRVFEDGHERPILEFEAPVRARPTTVVLVVDRSRSMLQEDRDGGPSRIDSLKAAVASFLEGLPRGSRIAVIAFGSEVDLIQPFTADRAEARRAVEGLRAEGGTRYFDAVAAALDLTARETGRRAILALTDGEDSMSQTTIDSVIEDSQRLGLPIHTLGLGTGPEVTSGALKRLATRTGGHAYTARDADQLRSIYEEIARKLGATYRLAYRSDRETADGTLRPIRVYYRQAARAGEADMFIRGMVPDTSGWPGLFLLLLGGLALVAIVPGRLAARLGKG